MIAIGLGKTLFFPPLPRGFFSPSSSSSAGSRIGGKKLKPARGPFLFFSFLFPPPLRKPSCLSVQRSGMELKEPHDRQGDLFFFFFSFPEPLFPPPPSLPFHVGKKVVVTGARFFFSHFFFFPPSLPCPVKSMMVERYG